MIRTYTQISEQQLLATRMMASTTWFNGHENSVDVFERFRIAGFQNPTLLADVVFVENAEAKSLLLIRSAPAPRLKRTRVSDAPLGIEIERVKNERFPLRIEN